MSKIVGIALNTAREAIRNKILYSILFFALLVVAIAGTLGSFSIGDQMKFIKDFCLMSISLFGVVIAIVLGVNLLAKELGKKTIFNILSKPVARWQFIVGKFLGLFATSTLIVAFMIAGVVTFLRFFEGHLDWGLVLAAIMTDCELMLVIAVALFFSSVVVTPTLAGMFTAAVFVAGRSSDYLRLFFTDEYPVSVQTTFRALYWLLPHLDRFNIADLVVYGQYLDLRYAIALVAYALGYTGILLLLSIALFQRREFS
ncbi:MAG TPA: ABC transporter permease subunit [Candidatus Kryptonia bacterium]|nr:ABC transporter permease subunit [Candidatus Kryptonia bacterium]